MTAFESRESLEEVLTKLAELVQADPAFLEASQGKTLTVSMEFPDWEVFFYTRFRDGQVEAGLEEPAETTIDLVMDSEVFDKIFTGKLNPAKAAVKGDLAFSGNVAAAMRFQMLLSDFSRLYQQAKQEVS